MQRFEPMLLEYNPDWVLVPGDVNSTPACALGAGKPGVKVAHVEAGLRSFDRMQSPCAPTHNLLKLAREAGVVLDEVRTEALITVTAFNIEARYPDLKRAFRQMCTPEYTWRQMTMIKELFEWLRSHLP